MKLSILSNHSSMEVYPKELQFEEGLADAAANEPDHAALEFSLINNHPMSQVFMIKSTCVKHLAVSPTCGFIKALDQIKVIFLDGFFPSLPCLLQQQLSTLGWNYHEFPMCTQNLFSSVL